MTALDRKYGTPCIVCGAPIVNGAGHDAGCMADPAYAVEVAARIAGGYAAKHCYVCGRVAKAWAGHRRGTPVCGYHARSARLWTLVRPIGESREVAQHD